MQLTGQSKQAHGKEISKGSTRVVLFTNLCYKQNNKLPMKSLYSSLLLQFVDDSASDHSKY